MSLFSDRKYPKTDWRTTLDVPLPVANMGFGKGGTMPSRASSPEKVKNAGNITATTSANSSILKNNDNLNTPKKDSIAIRYPYETPVSNVKAEGPARRLGKSYNLNAMGLNPNATTFVRTPQTENASPTPSTRSSLGNSVKTPIFLPSTSGTPKLQRSVSGTPLKAGAPVFKPSSPIVPQSQDQGYVPQGWYSPASGHHRSFSDSLNFSLMNQDPISATRGPVYPIHGYSPASTLHTGAIIGQHQFPVPTASPIAPANVYPNSNIFQVQRKASKKLEIKKPTGSPFGERGQVAISKAGAEVKADKEVVEQKKVEGNVFNKENMGIQIATVAEEPRSDNIDLVLKLEAPDAEKGGCKGMLESGVRDFKDNIVQSDGDGNQKTGGPIAPNNTPYFESSADNHRSTISNGGTCSVALREVYPAQESTIVPEQKLSAANLGGELNTAVPQIEDEEERLTKRALKEIEESIALTRPLRRFRPTVWNEELKRWEYVDEIQKNTAGDKSVTPKAALSATENQSSSLVIHRNESVGRAKPMNTPSRVFSATIQAAVTIYSTEFIENPVATVQSSPDAVALRPNVQVANDNVADLRKIIQDQGAQLQNLTDALQNFNHRLLRLEDERGIVYNNDNIHPDIRALGQRIEALEADMDIPIRTLPGPPNGSSGTLTPTLGNVSQDVGTPGTLCSAYSEADFDTFADRITSTPATPVMLRGEGAEQTGDFLLSFT